MVDIDRARKPFHVEVAPRGSEYVFNKAGQIISLDGLLCLFDEAGPCGNAVKDSQRIKTGAVCAALSLGSDIGESKLIRQQHEVTKRNGSVPVKISGCPAARLRASKMIG